MAYFHITSRLYAFKSTAHSSNKLDPYWSIWDMMKTNKALVDVSNSNTACYVIQSKQKTNKKQKKASSVC